LIYTTHNDEPINIDGTHRQGYIDCTYHQLTRLFGAPDPDQLNNGYKVDWEWNLTFDDGTIATIYNWKNGPNYCGKDGLHETQIHTWNVGGFTKQAVRNVESIIAQPVTHKRPYLIAEEE
tara:strand:- start:277 stop:636 length:360 start_codon:yes stop_codon:yes gene_type:complete